MKEFIDKLTSYNIFNYLFPGILFSAFGEHVSTARLLHENIIIGVFVYYFYGLVISRIGSLFLEPALKRIGLLQFSDYKDYIRASKTDSTIELLSETNNMYRTLASTAFCLLMLMTLDHLSVQIGLPSFWINMVLLFCLLGLFVFSYKKQTAYITKRVDISSKLPRE